jgi:putative endopeptidase
MASWISWTLRIAALACAIALAFSVDVVCAAAGLGREIDSAHFDRTCKPCDDFFQFVNGGWIAKNPIPAEYPFWGSYLKMRDDVRFELRQLLEQPSLAAAPHGTNEQKIRDFYASCMDIATIERAGVAPIQPLLGLAARADASNLPQTLAQLDAAGVDGFFDFGATADWKNSSQEVAYLSQGGLGLPDRDYYTRADEKSKSLVNAYQAHIAKMLQLLGDPSDTATSEAASIVQLETSLASEQFTIVQERNPDNVYHMMTNADVAAMAPQLHLDAFLRAQGIADSQTILVGEPPYFKAAGERAATLSPDVLHAYLRWHVVNAYANGLPSAFVDEHWNFYNKTLLGAKEQLPRWKRCVASTDTNLGEALGQLYVRKYFTPAEKAAVVDMVGNIKATLRDDISTLEWMSPQTREQAIKKLDAFGMKIGYPDKWRDYSKLEVAQAAYATNLIAATQFAKARNKAKIGHTVDRSEWRATPPTVNAFYSALNNEIVFPAGYLQPPMFDPSADMAVNYGALGSTIGHESTHGFDDSGRKFDASGNLNNWWTKEDEEHFNARAQCLVDQWDALEPLPGLHENGKQTLGENIADLGGLTIAYKAFERWQSKHPRQTIDGFSPEQRFFVGYAVSHLAYGSPDFIRYLTQADVHGFDKFRVNAALSDFPEFAQAFGCKAGDNLVRPKDTQCRIW